MQLLFIFLLDAAAEGGQNPGLFGGGSGMIFLLGMVAIFYFFMIRPQQKRAKEEKQFRESLEKGAKVMTIGGIYGLVESIEDTTVLVKVDSNTKLRFDKTALRAVPESGDKK